MFSDQAMCFIIQSSLAVNPDVLEIFISSKISISMLSSINMLLKIRLMIKIKLLKFLQNDSFKIIHLII